MMFYKLRARYCFLFRKYTMNCYGRLHTLTTNRLSVLFVSFVHMEQKKESMAQMVKPSPLKMSPSILMVVAVRPLHQNPNCFLYKLVKEVIFVVVLEIVLCPRHENCWGINCYPDLVCVSC